MSVGKESPRQKMIGMMYLVLTALLALNVAKTVLDAFVTVNNGLEATNSVFDYKNQEVYASLEKAYAIDSKKVKPFLDNALIAKNKSLVLNDYINNIKKEIISRVDNDKSDLEINQALIDLSLIDAKDNYDIPTLYLCGTDEKGQNGIARELKDKLNAYREEMFALISDNKILIDEKKKKQIISNLKDLGINTENPIVNNIKDDNPALKYWETANFYNTATVASICLLTKIQNDIKNAESQIINVLYNEIDASSFKFDTLAAKVISPNSYIIQGNDYEADLFVAAFSTTTNPIVLIGNEVKLEDGKYTFVGDFDTVNVKNGVGKYKAKGVKIGDIKKEGIIKLLKPGSETEFLEYLFNLNYQVAKPSVVVSPNAMNVFYEGVNNPISVSVAGFPSDKIKTSINQGKIIKKGDSLFVNEVKPGKAIVDVSVITEEGIKKMGQIEFRVKALPMPLANIFNKRNENCKRAFLISSRSRMAANIPNFLFNVGYRVKSFKMTAMVNQRTVGDESLNDKLTTKMIDIIQALPNNSKVLFEDIKVVGPTGRTEKIDGIYIIIKD